MVARGTDAILSWNISDCMSRRRWIQDPTQISAWIALPLPFQGLRHWVCLHHHCTAAHTIPYLLAWPANELLVAFCSAQWSFIVKGGLMIQTPPEYPPGPELSWWMRHSAGLIPMTLPEDTSSRDDRDYAVFLSLWNLDMYFDTHIVRLWTHNILAFSVTGSALAQMSLTVGFPF